MGKVQARNEATIAAPANVVADTLANYQIRPELQPENYSAFRVVAGGMGQGTIAAWNLQATKKRSRDVEAVVTETGDKNTEWTLSEADKNSTMVTTYTVRAQGASSCTLIVDTQWDGATGIGGFFERTFAPGGLKKIQQEQIEALRARVASN